MSDERRSFGKQLSLSGAPSDALPAGTADDAGTAGEGSGSASAHGPLAQAGSAADGAAVVGAAGAAGWEADLHVDEEERARRVEAALQTQMDMQRRLHQQLEVRSTYLAVVFPTPRPPLHACRVVLLSLLSHPPCILQAVCFNSLFLSSHFVCRKECPQNAVCHHAQAQRLLQNRMEQHGRYLSALMEGSRRRGGGGTPGSKPPAEASPPGSSPPGTRSGL